MICLYSGALNLTHEQFHTLVAPTVITDVACVGTENKLTECDYLTPATCGLLNDAGVVCQGKCTAYLYVMCTPFLALLELSIMPLHEIFASCNICLHNSSLTCV